MFVLARKSLLGPTEHPGQAFFSLYEDKDAALAELLLAVDLPIPPNLG